MVGPIIEELAGAYAGKVKVGKLNTDHNPGGRHQIRYSQHPYDPASQGRAGGRQFAGRHAEVGNFKR